MVSPDFLANKDKNMNKIADASINEFSKLPYKLWTDVEKNFDVCEFCANVINSTMKVVDRPSDDTMVCSLYLKKGEQSLVTLKLITLPKMRMIDVSTWVMLAQAITCNICNKKIYDIYENVMIRKTIEKQLSSFIGETKKKVIAKIYKISYLFTIEAIPINCVYEMDYYNNRIRVFYNKQHIVERISIG